jgi:hypothetical protein
MIKYQVFWLIKKTSFQIRKKEHEFDTWKVDSKYLKAFVEQLKKNIKIGKVQKTVENCFIGYKN